MSDTSRLGINITAQNAAGPTLRELQQQIATLEGNLLRIGPASDRVTQTLRSSMEQTLASVRATVAGLQSETTAINQVTAALHAQAEAATTTARAMAMASHPPFIRPTPPPPASQASRAEAEYLNRDIDLINRKAQAQARASQLVQQQAIQEEQRAADAARIEAEYTNAGINAQAAKARAEAEAENAAIDRRSRASVAQAAGSAAARVTAGGGTAAQAEAAGARAAAAAIERQAVAAKAAEAALNAARAAGVSEGEAVAISARAGAEALAAQEVAARRASSAGSGIGSVFQRESKHIVGLFDSLASGHRGQAMSSIGSAARDAGLGVAGLATSLVGLVAIMGGAAIIRGADNMGKWATQTRAAASAAGMSLEAYSSLQGALALTGVKADSADATLRRLAINLGAAIANPAGLTAEAFHNLGISQEQLVATGGNVEAAFKLLSDAFVRNADGANKSANLNQILGRSFENLIPAMQKGSEGFAELQAKAEALGYTLTDKTATAMEQTGEKSRSLGEAIEGNAIKAFQDWEPVINVLIDLLKTLSDTIGIVLGGLGKLASAPITALQAVTSYVGQTSAGSGHIERIGNRPVWRPGAAQQDTTMSPTAPGEPEVGGTAGKVQPAPLVKTGGAETPLEKMRLEMAQAADAASKTAGAGRIAREQAEGKAEIAVMQKTLQEATLNATQRDAIQTELSNKERSLRDQLATSQEAAGTKAAKQSYEDFAAGEKEKIAAADGSSAAIIATYDEWISAAEGKYKQHISVIESLERQKVQAVNSARLGEIKEGASLEEQVNKSRIVMGQAQTIAAGRGSGGAQGQGNVQAQVAQLAAEAQQIQTSAQNEVASLMQVMQTADEGSATQKAAAQEILTVVTQAKQQEIELYNKAAEATKAASQKATEAFTQMFDQFGSSLQTAFGSIFQAVVAPQVDLIKAGLTTIKYNERSSEIQAAVGKLLTSLGDSILKGLGDLASKLAGQAVAGLLHVTGDAAQGGLGSVLGAGVGKLFGVAQQAPQAASFGIAGTQLQLAATQLQAAAAALTGAGGAAGAGGVGAGAAAGAGGAAASAATTTAPIVSAITATSAAQTGATTAATAANTAATTAQTAALTGAIAAQTATEAAAMQIPKPLGFARGGIVPSAAGGMVAGGVGGTLAILHPREMVLPAHLSEGVQRMINGPNSGGNSSNANINYNPTVNVASRGRGGTGMTRAEFSQMLSTHSGGLLGEARNMARSGWRPA